MMTGLMMEQGVGFFLVGVAVKGIVVLSLSALAAVALRRRSAAGRHWAWLLGLVGLLVLPLVGLLGPRWSVPVPAVTVPAVRGGALEAGRGEKALRDAGPVAGEARIRNAATVANRRGGDGPVERASVGVGPGATEPVGTGSRAAPSAVHGGEGSSPMPMPVGTLLLVLWVGGVGALLTRLLGSHLAVRGLEARATTFAEDRVAAIARSLAERIGLRARVRLLRGGHDAIPMSWGVVRPRVLLPRGACAWPESRLRAVLLHEFAHVRRRDCLAQLLAELAVAFHWFNPLAWVAVHRLRVEREHACDDEVLSRGARPTQYATELVALAREICGGSAPSAAAVAILGPADLKARVRAVLDVGRPRTLPARAAAAGAVLAGAVILALAAVTPAEARVDADPDVLPSPVPALRTATPRPQATTCGMATDGWRRSSSRSEDGHRHRLEWSRPDCSVDVRIEGDVDFTDDFRAVARLGSGALVRIEETDGGTRRWLEITPGSGGRPAFEYRVDGQVRTFDADARAWYGAMMLQVVRRSGFRAEERVAGLLRSGGVGAVLTELEALTSDHVFAVYVEQLILQADLTEGQAVALTERAGRRVESDHYMAGILMALADRHLTSERGVDVFLAAARTLESDHYRAQVLGHALEHRTITGPQVAALIDAVAGMESDHYVAEVLTSVAGRYFLDGRMRATYLRAVGGVESDHYRAEILGTLMDRNDLGGEELGDVLTAVAEMKSDHYKTELLKRFASDPLLTDAQLLHVIDAVRVIESDHYQAALLMEIADQERVHAGALYDAMVRAMNTIESQHNRGQVAERLLRR